MKNISTIILILSSIQLFAQSYRLDISNSALTWTGYGEIGDFQQTGTIEAKNGVLKLDSSVIVEGEIIVDMKTIQHDDKSLSKHLKNDDFFYVKKYPIARIKLTKNDGAQITVDLTIRGITEEIVIPIEMQQSESRLTMKGKAVVDRTLFNIKYNSSSFFQDLGSYAIKNDFDLAFELVFEVI